MRSSYVTIPPIHRLPAEILSDCLCFLPKSTNSLDLKQTPWVFGHVCGRWREIGLSTPRLWADITLQRSIRPHERHAQYLLRLMLERSVPYPLSITVVAIDNRIALGILLTHSDRWESVEITDSDQARSIGNLDMGSILRSSSIPLFPRLSAVRVTVHYHARRDNIIPHDGPLPFFHRLLDSPTLRSVYLRCHQQHVPPSAWYASSWANLIHLDLTIIAVDIDEMITVLSYCPLLVSCAIRIWFITPVMKNEHRIIALPDLSSLHLEVGSSDTLSLFFGHLSLPRLTQLHCEYIDESTPSTLFLSSFIAFVQRSGCAIEHLGAYFGDRFSHLDELLRHLPHLRSVRLRTLSDGLAPELLSLLTCGEADAPMCPELQYVVLDKGTPRVDANAIQNLIHSRSEREDISRIGQVQLYNGVTNAEGRQLLQRLVENGSVYLSY